MGQTCQVIQTAVDFFFQLKEKNPGKLIKWTEPKPAL